MVDSTRVVFSNRATPIYQDAIVVKGSHFGKPACHDMLHFDVLVVYEIVHRHFRSWCPVLRP